MTDPAPRSALLSNSLMDDLNRQSSVSTAKPMSVATTSSGRNGADESPQPQGEIIRKALSLFTDKHSVRILSQLRTLDVTRVCQFDARMLCRSIW